MSNLKIVGREPRGSRDVSTLSSLEKLNERLVKQSELSGIVSQHFGNLDVVSNSEYNSFVSPYASSTDVANEFSQYIKRGDPEVIYLDDQGKVPKSLFQQNIVTRASVVTQGTTFASQSIRTAAGSYDVVKKTLPSLPYETIPLVFGTFMLLRLNVPVDVYMQAGVGTSGSAVTISAGKNSRLQTGGTTATPGYYTITMTPINLQQVRLAAGMSHEIALSMSIATSNAIGEQLLGVTEARPEIGWTIIQIPSGSGL